MSDAAFHVVMVVVTGGGFWIVVKYLARITSIYEDFPPHRHLNGDILYPKGYSPGELSRSAAAGRQH